MKAFWKLAIVAAIAVVALLVCGIKSKTPVLPSQQSASVENAVTPEKIEESAKNNSPENADFPDMSGFNGLEEELDNINLSL